MGFTDQLRSNFKDISLFGPKIALRHVARFAKIDTISVASPEVGKFSIRPRDSDIATFRDIFGQDYAAFSNSYNRERLGCALAAITERGSTPVIIDAGANVGAASLWFRSRFPAATIVAIEPVPSNLRLLRMNLEKYDNVNILAAAVGSQPGFVTLDGGFSDGLSFAVQTARSDEGIPIVTIKQAVNTVPSGELLIVKIDIEGFEDDLFASNTDWIDSTAMIIIEPHDWLQPGRHTTRCLQREMGKRNFDLYVCGENLVYIRCE